jgi:chromosome segregation ATPase
MPRPQIDEDVHERLTEAADEQLRVPATHLDTEERLVVVLDELEAAAGRVEYLSDRVETLEEELEAARREREETGVDDPTGPLGGVNPNERF